MASGMDVEGLLEQLGGYGRYQVLLFIALGLLNMRGAWHVFASIFVGWTPQHYCTPPANHTLNQSLPLDTDDNGETTWSQCKMFREAGTQDTPHSNDTVDCQHGWTYVFDRQGETSIVGDWDMVCDDNYLAELAVTLYMVGAACGTLFLTPLSDCWGRKTVMLACLWLQAAVGVSLIFCTSAVPYIVLQFFIGICNMTIALCFYILLVETFDRNTREIPALSLQFFWAGGIMLLSLLAYLLPHWRHLELTVSLPQLLTISYIWLVPESLTWLLIKGKITRAKAIILTILRVNKLSPIPDLDKTLSSFVGNTDQALQVKGADDKTDNKQASDNTSTTSKENRPTASYTVLDLFKTPKLCRYSICLFYLYMVNSLSYFGIAFYTPLLSGDKYLNTFISGVVEIPAHIICIICNHRIGRRWPILGFLLICAVGNISVIFIPAVSDSGQDLSSLRTALVLVGKFGITGSYSALYLYGTEIFPTAIRNHAVGLCTFFDNIGSIAAPQIVYAAKSMTELPMTIFGAMTVVGALVILLLPETHNQPLPQTLEEAELRGHLSQKNRNTTRKYYINEAIDVTRPD